MRSSEINKTVVKCTILYFVAVGTLLSPAPPVQIRTGSITAYGSYLGCLASKRRLGWGCRILALGIKRSTNGQNRSQVIRSRLDSAAAAHGTSAR
jgi:hypothetical protein